MFYMIGKKNLQNVFKNDKILMNEWSYNINTKKNYLKNNENLNIEFKLIWLNFKLNIK